MVKYDFNKRWRDRDNVYRRLPGAILEKLYAMISSLAERLLDTVKVNEDHPLNEGKKYPGFLRRNWKKIIAGLGVGGVAVGLLGFVGILQEEHKQVNKDTYAIIFEQGSGSPGVEKCAWPEYIAYDVLTKYGNVPEKNITLLMNWKKDATLENFETAVNQIAEKVNENSVVFVSLGGHGYAENATGITGIASFEDFDRIIDRITKGKVLVSVDACGSYTEALRDGPCPRVVVQQVGPGENAAVSSSMLANMFMAFTGPDKKYTFYPPYPNYIYNLNADQLDNTNGIVSVLEAYRFAENQIRSYDIESGVRGARNPQIWDPENIGAETYLVRIPIKYQDKTNVGPRYHEKIIENRWDLT